MPLDTLWSQRIRENKMILRQPKPRVFLSLTPLIDVVFILLIFFMLVSQFSSWRNIELLSQAGAAGGTGDEAVIALQLNNSGSFELDGEMIGSLGEVIVQLSIANRTGPLFLSAESTVQMQRILDVIETLSGAGMVDVTLVEPTVRATR